jgi:hypothetical protein
MNPKIACLVGMLVGVPSLLAQEYVIDWHTIDGGGGSSAGGFYMVTGSIGQPDSGALSGGNFTLIGGFWAGAVASQSPGAPSLSILHIPPRTVILAWPVSAAGWTLEQNSEGVYSRSWSEVTAGVQVEGEMRKLVLDFSEGVRFFRLKKVP